MTETIGTETTEKPRCSGVRTNGEPCRSTALGQDGRCSVHNGSVPFGDSEFARQAGLKSGEKRREKAEERAKSLRDRLAAELEKDAEKIVAVYRRCIDSGSDELALRASEAWQTRVFGRPKETVELDQHSKMEAEVYSMDMADMEARLQEVLRQAESDPATAVFSAADALEAGESGS